MFTQTSFYNKTFTKHIRQALWLAKLESCKTKKRCTQYVQNRKGRNVLRIDVYPSGDMAAYASGSGSRDYTSVILKALEGVTMNIDEQIHIDFQEYYRREFPGRVCRIQNLIDTYTTIHADCEFTHYCERLTFERWLRSDEKYKMFPTRYHKGVYESYRTNDLYNAFTAGRKHPIEA